MQPIGQLIQTANQCKTTRAKHSNYRSTHTCGVGNVVKTGIFRGNVLKAAISPGLEIRLHGHNCLEVCYRISKLNGYSLDSIRSARILRKSIPSSQKSTVVSDGLFWRLTQLQCYPLGAGTS